MATSMLAMNTRHRKPGQPSGRQICLERIGSSELRINSSPKTERQGKTRQNPPGRCSCGAMSQQGGEFRGNISAPQKFVHLVGCRDRKAGPGLEARQYPNPVKR